MIIEGGYYIKARQINDSVIAHVAPHIRELWDWLLKNTRYADKKYMGFIIKKGQIFTQYNEIRDDLHWYQGYIKKYWSISQLKRGMYFLIDEEMVTVEKKPRGILITLVNHSFY